MDSIKRLTDPDVKPRVDAYMTEIAADPEKAKAFLVRCGILLESGELAPHYRTEPK